MPAIETAPGGVFCDKPGFEAREKIGNREIVFKRQDWNGIAGTPQKAYHIVVYDRGNIAEERSPRNFEEGRQMYLDKVVSFLEKVSTDVEKAGADEAGFKLEDTVGDFVVVTRKMGFEFGGKAQCSYWLRIFDREDTNPILYLYTKQMEDFREAVETHFGIVRHYRENGRS